MEPAAGEVARGDEERGGDGGNGGEPGVGAETERLLVNKKIT